MTAPAVTLLRALVIAALLIGCSAPSPTSSETLTPRASSAPNASVPSSVQTRYAAAQAAVTLFHVRFDQRQFTRMYEMTDTSVRASLTQASFVSAMTQLRDRVGGSVDEQETQFDLDESGADVVITLYFETAFSNDVLNETFVWRVTRDEKTFLLSYNVE